MENYHTTIGNEKPYPGELSQTEIELLEGNGMVLEDKPTELNRVRSAWGDSRIVLTPDILEDLKKGGVWIHSDGEYTTEIRWGKDE